MTALPGRQLWAQLSTSEKPAPRRQRVGQRLVVTVSFVLLLVVGLMAAHGWLPGAQQ